MQQSLKESVNAAATYLSQIDETQRDGDQTVRQILAHLVFWHREYVAVIGALADGRKPKLRVGKYHALNTLGYLEFQNVPMRVLTKRWIRLQSELENVTRTLRVGNANVKCAFKEGARQQRIADWLPRIQAHIDGHVRRLRQLEKKTKRTR